MSAFSKKLKHDGIARRTDKAKDKIYCSGTDETTFFITTPATVREILAPLAILKSHLSAETTRRYNKRFLKD